jgi:hypothetical protein
MQCFNNYSGNNFITNPAPMPKYQKKIQINKQVQDNLRILDCMIRTMSTVENLCNIKYNDKKYNIDKKDIYSLKSHDQIKDDFLMNIQCLNSMIQIYKKRNNSNKPKILPPYDKKDLKTDLDIYRKIIISKEPELDIYFNDFSNLIDGNNCKIYSNNEMLSSFKNQEQVDEKKINHIAQNIILQGEKEKRKMEKVLEKYNMTGQVDLENSGDQDENINCDDD